MSNEAMSMFAQSLPITLALLALMGGMVLNFKAAGKIEARLDRLDAKVDAGFERADARMDALFHRLDAKMDAGFNRLDAKIDMRADRLDDRMAKIEEDLGQFNVVTARLETRVDALANKAA